MNRSLLLHWLTLTALSCAGWLVSAGLAQVIVTENSAPPGFVTPRSWPVELGEPTTTTAVAPEVGAYRFSRWLVNGTRSADELGRSLNPAYFVVTEPTTVVAYYLDAILDADGDGIPDWFEELFVGNLAANAAADADGDGFTMAQEFARDYHPGLVDVVADGGLARRGSGLLLVVQDAGYAVFQRGSTPPGLLADVTAPVAVGAEVTLLDVYGLTNQYRFAEWRVNGERVADELGRSVGGLGFTLASNTTAVARYFREDEDVDGDGVPDWYEWHYYGTLSQAAAADTDGDGFTLAQEWARDWHPQLVDTPVDGGISRRGTARLTVFNVNYTTFQQISDPLGLVEISSVVLTNSWQPLADVYGTQSGFRFGQWFYQNERVADELGRSVGGLPILIGSNAVATARFYREDEDVDGDGVPDWYEWHYYGTLSQTAAADTDGDGFTLAQEWARDTHPNLADGMADGGIARRSSVLTMLDLRGNAFYKIISDPPGVVDESGLILAWTPVQTTNLAGSVVGDYRFGYWDVNGVRQLDAGGYPLPEITFLVITNTTVTAVYLQESADTDGDGLPDWWEVLYFGDPTVAVAGVDSDHDGLTNLAEFLAGTHPRLATSRLTITHVQPSLPGWEIGFTSVSGKVYQVQYATNLTLSTTWELLADDVNGNGTTNSVVDSTAAGETKRFYRVKLKP